jgi:NAD(P)-dependent dehydrogenase (short-subunit alcohol dehydrogenase family)
MDMISGLRYAAAKKEAEAAAAAAAGLDTSHVPNFADLLRLDGRGFIVIGAGNGIGRQTSHALSQLGAKVLCVDIDAARADAVAAEVGGVGLAADARQRTEAERIVATAVERFGSVTGLVDIVGMARYRKLLDTPEEDWDWTFGIVLQHAYQMIHAAGPAIAAAGGGNMTFVASIDGEIAAPFHAPYGAMKAGLLNLVRTASVELGPMQIRVNAVCPGPTATPRVLELLGGNMPAGGDQGGSFYIPLREVNQTWDIASALLFLSSPLSRMITGQAIRIDGGGANLIYDIDRLPGA